MAFSFGAPAGNGPAPSAAPPSTGGFSFGQSTPAPAPATTGAFSFGGSSTPAPAPSGGFSFASNPAPASTTPGFGFGGNSPAPPPSAAPASSFASSNQPQQQQTANYAVASDFEKAFPGKAIASKLMVILSDSFSSVYVQQELVDLLPECQDWLLNLEVPAIVPANQAIRQQMGQQQHVKLSNGQVAPLNKKLLQQIKSLSDDLHISETDAIALLEHAGIDSVRQELPGPFVVPVSDKATPLVDNVPWAARELYFYNRLLQFKCLLQLWQWRAGAVVSDPDNCERILVATDALLQQGLVTKILNFVRSATTRIGMWMAEVAKMEAEEQASGMLNNANRKGKNFAKLHLQQMVEERQYVIECLFFIAYQTQMTCQEVADIVDLICQLTNSAGPTGGLPILDPFNDVPDVHQPGSSTSPPWGAATTTTVTKQREEWEKEWVQQAWTSGRAPLSRCVAILTMTVIAALDTKTLLMDRTTHAPNVFGPVSYKSLIIVLSRFQSSHSKLFQRGTHFCRKEAHRWKESTPSISVYVKMHKTVGNVRIFSAC